MMGDVAGQHGLFAVGADQHAHVARRVAGGGDQGHFLAQPVIACHQDGEPARHDRPHRVLEHGPVLAGRAVRGPVVVLVLAEHVAGLGEGRHPLAAGQRRIPADMVDVQMRAQHGVDAVRRIAGGGEIAPAVKADAYGHGAAACAHAALAAGANRLGVARIEEGLALRRAGITRPILVLGPPNPQLLGPALRAGLSLSVGTPRVARLVAEAAAELGVRAAVHLEIDTGMRRYGLEPDVAVDVARMAASGSDLQIEGVYSHFATADEASDRFAHEQAGRFAAVWEALRRFGVTPPYVHLANSAATLRPVPIQLDGSVTVVQRVGLALYGLSPSASVPVPPAFRPVMTLKTRLARVFNLAAGEGVSYGLTYVTERPVRCATVPVGYGDGLPLRLSNHGWLAIDGAACPIRGRVCMDQTVIEVDGAGAVAEGDEAVVFGPAPGAMTVDDVARLAGTINYEVVTAVAARVPRIYLEHGRPVAIADLEGLERTTS